MKEGQSGIYYVTGRTTIPPMCPSDPLIAQPSMVALMKNDLVVTYSIDPLSGCAMQLLHEEPGTWGMLCSPCEASRSGWSASLLWQSRLGGMLWRVAHDSEGADLERPEDRVKPKKNQTAQDQAAKKLKKQRLAPKDDSDTSNSERCSTTGTGSSTTATGTTGQAAATKLHKA